MRGVELFWHCFKHDVSECLQTFCLALSFETTQHIFHISGGGVSFATNIDPQKVGLCKKKKTLFLFPSATNLDHFCIHAQKTACRPSEWTPNFFSTQISYAEHMMHTKGFGGRTLLLAVCSQIKKIRGHPTGPCSAWRAVGQGLRGL